MTPITGIFHDALTGETIERELTDEEIASFMGDVVVPDAPQVVQVNVLQDMDNPRKYTSIISIAVDATMAN